MENDIGKWVDLDACPLSSNEFTEKCRQKLAETGCLQLPNFLRPEARVQMVREAEEKSCFTNI